MNRKTMMALAVLALALAGCGVDGPPRAPAAGSPPPGISVTGDASIGMRAEL